MQTVGLLVLNKVTPYLTNAIIIEKLVMFMTNVHILPEVWYVHKLGMFMTNVPVRHELGTTMFYTWTCTRSG